MEPLTVLEPENNFLEEVKKMAHHYGALLIFDEVITGFRYSFGGAQELTGVTPDLTCLAKAISNAIPLSAIVGKKEYMSTLDQTFFSFTYGGDCLGLAAAKTCIPKMKNNKVLVIHAGQ
jgi:glutamate-1-semialdehyde aminotransferase